MLQLADFVRLAQRTQHIEGGAGPTSVPMPSFTRLRRACCRSNSPLPRNRLEVGQNAIAERVSHRQSHSCSSGAGSGRTRFAADHAIAVVNVQIALALREQ